MDARQIRSALACGRQSCECGKGGVKTHCPGPGHRNGDRHPSLGVNEKDGKVLVRCHGGCDQMAVIAALQAQDLWPRKEATPKSGRVPFRIVATYDYRRADGGLAFQVVRLEPKDFRQRRPNGSGGWDYKKGDTSIVYRLPELLAASDTEIVYLCEGEKDADRLAGLGLVATTRAEGAGKWSDGNSRWLKGRRVAILADNDEAGAKDATLKLASIGAVAKAAVVTLDGLPEKGDVSDWLDAGGTKARLLEMAEAALAHAPEAPAAPIMPRPTLAPFPVRTLPLSLRTLIESGSAAMLVPAEFIAVPMLVLAGSVIGNAWEIELKAGWREGPNLYAGIVGDPGAKKTPSMKLALRGLHRIQERLHSDYKRARADYDAELALWEKLSKRDKEETPKPEAPTFKHVWTSDSTTEALAEMLAGSKGIVLFRDELVGWVKSMDQYRSGKGADRQHYLSMWSRSQIKIDRKSAPAPIIVDRPCLSVVGGIQPDVLPDLVENASRDDGFIDRLLFSYPDIGEDRWTDTGVDQSAQVAVERLFSNLYDLAGQTLPDGETVPYAARLSPEARALWSEWYGENAQEQASDELPSSLKGSWAKMPSQLARLALILHVGHAVDTGKAPAALIDEGTLAQAVVLVDYFKDHTRAVLGELRAPRSQLEERILRGLSSRGPSTTREIHVDILAGSVKYDRVKATLERLLEEGLVSARDVKPEGGGRPGRRWAATEQSESKDRNGHREPYSKRGAM